jgi:hypothetical protein
VITHLTPVELAERWRMPTGTLRNWRSEGTGPTYIKIGQRVLYPVADVEAFEAGSKVETVA